MGERKKLLVADDDAAIRKAYRILFASAGYAVATAKDGAEAVEKFAADAHDLVLLDVMMPRKNGLAACVEIRKIDPLVPILFFTAAPSEVSMVAALGLGADDYIEKDRSPDEFLARVASALRRSDSFEAAKRAGSPDRVNVGGAFVDFARLTIVPAGGGEAEALTRSEGVALKLLADSPGRFFTCAEILSAVRGDGYVGDDGAVRVLMSRVKRKMGRAGSLVVNSRGSGYKLVE